MELNLLNVTCKRNGCFLISASICDFKKTFSENFDFIEVYIYFNFCESSIFQKSITVVKITITIIKLQLYKYV